MSFKAVDAGMIKKYFLAGARNLEANREWVDELNVFPVPDGDTGTNMTMTLLSAVNEVSQVTDPDMESVCKAISKGSLRGARGNSGVILSQLLRGFTRSAQNSAELTIPDVAEGFAKAVETAYKAVMKPKEGTILTVAREMAEKGSELAGAGLSAEDYLDAVIRQGEDTLARTPDMLPVLKQANVVDAGGQGLILFLKGIHACMLGKTPEIDEEIRNAAAKMNKTAQKSAPAAAEAEIKFGYCTEFIINLVKPVPDEQIAGLKEFLDGMGDSIVLVADDEFIKIHVHTNEPGTVLQKALTFGEMTRIKIDNMREEHRELLGLGGAALDGSPDVVKPAAGEKKDDALQPAPVMEEPKDYGFISVAAGEGFGSIFRDLNVDIVISGGQTMNPSTDDFLEAIGKINARTIFILPDNSNIILAANQAADLTEDKKAIVIPSKTVPQGITAMLFFDASLSAEENETSMKEMIATVKTVSVTYAIRDSFLNGHEIHEGDIMAVGDEGILAVGNDITEVAMEGTRLMVDDETGLISIYYGEGFDEAGAGALAERLKGSDIYCDIEVHHGGQPVYYCVISVE